MARNITSNSPKRESVHVGETEKKKKKKKKQSSRDSQQEQEAICGRLFGVLGEDAAGVNDSPEPKRILWSAEQLRDGMLVCVNSKQKSARGVSEFG